MSYHINKYQIPILYRRIIYSALILVWGCFACPLLAQTETVSSPAEGIFTISTHSTERPGAMTAIVDLGGKTLLYNPHFFPQSFPTLLDSLIREGLSTVRYVVFSDGKAITADALNTFGTEAEIIADLPPNLSATLHSHITFDQTLTLSGSRRQATVRRLKNSPLNSKLIIVLPEEEWVLGEWPVSDIPAATDNLQTTDGLLHYTIQGNQRGLPIVLLSGGPGYSSSYLQPVAERLALNDRIILPDLRGTGQSKLAVYSPETLNIALICADLDTLRESLGLKEWVVYGHAFGGMLAMEYAARYPENVKGLVLSNSGGMDGSFLEPFGDNYEMRLTQTDRDSLWFWENDFRKAQNPDRAWRNHFRIEQIPYLYDRRQIDRLIKYFPAGSFSEKTSDLLWLDFETNYHPGEALTNFKKPVLILSGRQDPIGAATAYQIHATLSHAQLTFLERCGHYPWIEQPGEYFHAISQFLNEVEE
ncbi:MAG: alpha/beta hydrolase [Bacteroidia bacterium]|nr:alpha/beta hydrolase [Bacteroidia bacterium]